MSYVILKLKLPEITLGYPNLCTGTAEHKFLNDTLSIRTVFEFESILIAEKFEEIKWSLCIEKSKLEVKNELLQDAT